MPRSFSPLGLLLAFTLLLPVLPARGQAPEGRARFAAWSYQDAAALGGRLVGPAGLYTLGVTAALLPLTPLDPGIGDELREMRHGTFGTFLDATNELGGPRATLPVAGLFAISLLTDDARFQDAAFTSLQSLLYAGALTYGAKYTVGRLRPNEARGAFRFAPFSGNTSFPSGHTAAAFAIVTPWVLYYPHPVTYGLFAVSTGTALARMARDKHWATDVLAGGAVGFLTAYWLTRRHQKATGRVSVTPSIAPGHASLSLRIRL